MATHRNDVDLALPDTVAKLISERFFKPGEAFVRHEGQA
jgi:hypothetical protein